MRLKELEIRALQAPPRPLANRAAVPLSTSQSVFGCRVSLLSGSHTSMPLRSPDMSKLVDIDGLMSLVLSDM